MPLFSESDLSVRAAARDHRPELAGEIARVFPDGPAAQAGLQPGDLIAAVNGRPVEDVIDVQFHAAEERCVLTIVRAGERMEVEVDKNIDQQLGLEFVDDLFDGIRLCANRCDFCFVDQQPKGMRSTLGIRDDDFRLSFLHGNFVTLTNLSARDWDRIFRQGLSPLYISVHATDTALRQRLLRTRKPADVMEQIHRLIDGGISVHTQVVLCRGVNDGEVLDRTIADLSALYPKVESLAVVPMGVTDYRLERNESPPYDRTTSRAVLHQIRVWQRRFEARFGERFVTPSDEFYLVAGKLFPKAYTYGSFPQLSNGVGGSRLFLDELRWCLRHTPRESRRGRVQLVTGALAAPLIQRFADVIGETLGYQAQVVPAVNNWYGNSVTVAGLLTGRDVRDALNRSGHADLVLIPSIMLREDTDLFLDDMRVPDIARATRRSVLIVSPWPREALALLTAW